ncbi:Dihydroorotase [Pichia kudriavzevii]|uniref:Dihydroorotase n=1 Tax=Pichia kudriavzevii TaxID=4909 RepID=A0A1V2LT20_PICKU|nr:Dihydroorotase [Pichia kudriavzevii]
MSRIELGHTADYHVHLRQGEMMEVVTPAVREGGISIAYIMPNLTPPLTDIERVAQYKKDLQKLAPKTTFLMTFYLSNLLTPEIVARAADEGVIRGIKCYPAGVTTNSQAGVDPNDFSAFYPIFKTMEEKNLVLNLHEPKVVASLTAHHLFLTIDDWAGNPINFCKPVAKLPEDRRALLSAAVSGKPFFFFGSDSAPHDLSKKATHVGVCAGVYTQQFAIAYVAEIFDKVGKLDMLKDFVSTFGNNFYGMDESKLVCKDRCVLVKKDIEIPDIITFDHKTLKLAPFKPVEKLSWTTEWI